MSGMDNLGPGLEPEDTPNMELLKKRIEELEAGSLFKSNRIADLVKDYTELQRNYEALTNGIKRLHDNLVGAFPTRDSINDEGWRIVRALEKEFRDLLKENDDA